MTIQIYYFIIAALNVGVTDVLRTVGARDFRGRGCAFAPCWCSGITTRWSYCTVDV